MRVEKAHFRQGCKGVTVVKVLTGRPKSPAAFLESTQEICKPGCKSAHRSNVSAGPAQTDLKPTLVVELHEFYAWCRKLSPNARRDALGRVICCYLQALDLKLIGSGLSICGRQGGGGHGIQRVVSQQIAEIKLSSPGLDRTKIAPVKSATKEIISFCRTALSQVLERLSLAPCHRPETRVDKKCDSIQRPSDGATPQQCGISLSEGKHAGTEDMGRRRDDEVRG